MAVKYSIVEMGNPSRPDEKKKFYAKAQANGVVDLNNIAEEISYASSLTDGDVLNALRGLIKMMKMHLSNGEIVNLGEFGTFQFQLSSEGAKTKDEFTSANIRKARFQFRPGLLVREAQKTLKYERVDPLPQKAKKPTEPAV